MRGFLEREEGDFFAWLQKLTVARNERMTSEDRYASAAWGAVEAARAGVTCVGDASDTAAPCLRALGRRGPARHRLSGGVRAGRARGRASSSTKLREKVERERAGESELVVARRLAARALLGERAAVRGWWRDTRVAENLPLMIHAAESEAEEQFMREGRGPFAEGLRRRGIEWNAPGVSLDSIPRAARRHGAAPAPRTLRPRRRRGRCDARRDGHARRPLPEVEREVRTRPRALRGLPARGRGHRVGERFGRQQQHVRPARRGALRRARARAPPGNDSKTEGCWAPTTPCARRRSPARGRSASADSRARSKRAFRPTSSVVLTRGRAPDARPRRPRGGARLRLLRPRRAAHRRRRPRSVPRRARDDC